MVLYPTKLKNREKDIGYRVPFLTIKGLYLGNLGEERWLRPHDLPLPPRVLMGHAEALETGPLMKKNPKSPR